jgi:hypothetical protein
MGIGAAAERPFVAFPGDGGCTRFLPFVQPCARCLSETGSERLNDREVGHLGLNHGGPSKAHRMARIPIVAATPLVSSLPRFGGNRASGCAKSSTPIAVSKKMAMWNRLSVAGASILLAAAAMAKTSELNMTERINTPLRTTPFVLCQSTPQAR